MNGGKVESEMAALRKSVVEALTGTSVECEGVVAGHTEELTEKGARDVLDRLAARGFEVVRRA